MSRAEEERERRIAQFLDIDAFSPINNNSIFLDSFSFFEFCKIHTAFLLLYNIIYLHNFEKEVY